MATKVLKLKDASREEWLEKRRSFIGGSDAATCVDLNPWSDKLTLFCDKKGLLPEKDDNFAMRMGRELEDLVAKFFTEATGKEVRNDNFSWVSDEHDYIGADVDRTIVGENAALECKTINAFSKYDLEGGEIPQQYYCQLQHYMYVMGYDYMYIAFIQFGKGFFWHKVDRNNEDIKALIDAEVYFWENYIVKDVKPDADGSESSMETLRKMYPQDTGMSVILNDSDDDLLTEIKSLQAAQKRLKEQEEELKTKICGELEDYTTGTTDNFIVTWKAQKRTSVDSKKLKADFPDIYEKVKKETTSRVLRIKEDKKNDK